MTGHNRFGFCSLVACCVASIVAVQSTLAGNIQVPNGNFDTLLKPSNELVSATPTTPGQEFWGYAGLNGSNGTYGAIASLASGFNPIHWSDGSTSTAGQTVEVPGWTGSGAVQATGENGTWDMAQNNNEQFQSFSSLGTIAPGVSYTLSADAYDLYNPNTLYLTLQANGVPLTSTSIPLTGNWATYSITYTAAQLAPFVGENLTIRAGATSGGQVQIDNITLTSAPEPASSALLGFAALGLLARRPKARRHPAGVR